MAHSPIWGWYPEGNRWVKLRVDADGSIHVVGYVDNLSDIGDVDVAGIADDDILYWDDIAGEWTVIAHLGVADAHHARYTDAEAVDAIEADDNLPVAAIVFIIDGGGAEITLLEKGHLEIPFACTINRVTLLADQVGSIVIDIWKDIYANFPPTVADTITAAAKPTIAVAQKSQDSALVGWTTAIAAGDILAFNVDSVTDIERVTLVLKVTKT